MLNCIVDITSFWFLVYIIGLFIKKCVERPIMMNDDVMLDVKDRYNDLLNTHPIVKDELNENKFKENREFSLINTIFRNTKSTIMSSIKMFILLFGIAPMALYFMNTWGVTADWYLWVKLSCMSVVWSFILMVIDIPFDWYSDKINKKFGYSNLTLHVYISDFIKSFLVNSVLTTAVLGIAYGLLSVIQSYGPMNYKTGIIFFAVSVVLSIVVDTIYSQIIMPLFNKYTPVEDGELKDKMKVLVEKYGYKFDNVYIVNESLRTNFGNAYCMSIPFGPKKIVIYDTLLKQLTTDEIVGIFAHEFAHKKFYHNQINYAMMFVGGFIKLMFVIGVMYNIDLYHAFGFNMITLDNVMQYSIIGINLGLIIFEAFSWIIDPFTAWISRKMEYAADKYGAIYCGNIEAMITGLIKIHTKSGDVGVHTDSYEGYFCGHPSLTNRIKALNDIKEMIQD